MYKKLFLLFLVSYANHALSAARPIYSHAELMQVRTFWLQVDPTEYFVLFQKTLPATPTGFVFEGENFAAFIGQKSVNTVLPGQKKTIVLPHSTFEKLMNGTLRIRPQPKKLQQVKKEIAPVAIAQAVQAAQASPKSAQRFAQGPAEDGSKGFTFKRTVQ